MIPRDKPKRLNLAIARRCHVSCAGCYSYFGQSEPDLEAITSSVREFVHLGVTDVTLSGGDPLTIATLPEFLEALRSIGVTSIKVDTVGVGLLSGSGEARAPSWGVSTLVEQVNYLGLPLDGWSNETANWFRQGRHNLYTETVALLGALDHNCTTPRVVINTVAHKENLFGLDRIYHELTLHRAICHWNVFQYTVTDQAAAAANQRFCVSDQEFERARQGVESTIAAPQVSRNDFAIEFRTSNSRLGEYLLINSDGQAWAPDENGRTLRLGRVFGAEREVLERWVHVVAGIRQEPVSETTKLVISRVIDHAKRA